jgi:rRNA maturation protein Nop10
MIPKLNVSTLSSKSCPYNIYGATNPGVPAYFSSADKFAKAFL